MLIDYGTLKIIWWFLIFALFALFFIFGGRDLGVSILHPFVAKSDDERRLLMNSIGATWEGNQVWLITAGGALFAAWPIVYASAFSGLYFAFFLVLLSLILRPPSFDFRSKLASQTWRFTWDWALFVSGIVPALVLGVGLGNLFLGVPFHYDALLQLHYEGTFLELLNPFSLFFGVSAVCIMMLHGAAYLQKKCGDQFQISLQKISLFSGLGFIVLFLLLGGWIALFIQGYQIDSKLEVNESLIPITKMVSQHSKLWLINFANYPLLWLLPAFTIVAVLLTMVFSAVQLATGAVCMSSLAILFALGTANAALFPFILPSSTHPGHSLTLWDSASSYRTLLYMFAVAVIFLPIVLSYTFWVFRVLTGKMEKRDIVNNNEFY